MSSVRCGVSRKQVSGRVWHGNGRAGGSVVPPNCYDALGSVMEHPHPAKELTLLKVGVLSIGPKLFIARCWKTPAQGCKLVSWPAEPGVYDCHMEGGWGTILQLRPKPSFKV